VNGIEVVGDVRIALVRKASCESSGGGVGHGVSTVGKVSDSTLCGPVALNVPNNWVYISRNGDRVIRDVVFECNLGLQTKDEGGARGRWF